MQDFITVTGMILKSAPVGEYDRRVVILTKERGKIGAFVKGARKPTSRFVASCDPFCFGNFKLIQGREAYTVLEADIVNYFEELRNDFDGACYGFYFCEIADYYTRENNDEAMMLKLLYQSFRALISDKLDNKLVKAIFEIKALCVNGEYPGLSSGKKFNDSTLYAADYVEKSSIEKLFTFQLSDEVKNEFAKEASELIVKVTDHKFKSLEILKLV